MLLCSGRRPSPTAQPGASMSRPSVLTVMRPLRATVLFFLVFVFVAAAQITLNPTPSRVIGQLSTKITSTNPNLVEGRELEFPVAVVVDASTNPSPLYV